MSAGERTAPSAGGTRRLECGERAVALAPHPGPVHGAPITDGGTGASALDAVVLLPPLATVVIDGLVTSTLLTLFVLPTLYGVIERWRARRLAARGRELATGPAMPVGAPYPP